jgi:hypothetical protein
MPSNTRFLFIARMLFCRADVCVLMLSLMTYEVGCATMPGDVNVAI